MRAVIIFLIAIFILQGCALASFYRKVRPQDLKSWEGIPVSALDTHSLFLTLPEKRTLTEDKVEIRVYSNKKNIAHCLGVGKFNSYLTCTAGLIGCDNIFYIKEGRVIRYVPTGRCYTDDTVRPEKDWQQLR